MSRGVHVGDGGGVLGGLEYGRTVTKQCRPGDMIRLVAYYSVRVEHVSRSVDDDGDTEEWIYWAMDKRGDVQFEG